MIANFNCKKKCNHLEAEQITRLLHTICVSEPGKIETAPTPATEKQDYIHGDVKNVIMRLQLTNVLNAIKLNPIHIRVISTNLITNRRSKIHMLDVCFLFGICIVLNGLLTSSIVLIIDTGFCKNLSTQLHS
jgi:hypothetical protein